MSSWPVVQVGAGDNNIGNVDVLTIAAGDNNIGNVDVLTIAAGDNNIGNVDVLTIAAGGAPDVGAQNEAAPGTDTAASGLNGRLQRIAQRLTALIGLLPAALTTAGNLKVAVQESRAASGAYASAVSVTNAATQIVAANAARLGVEIHHQGTNTARVWLGADNTLTAGAAGKNFGYLDAGDTWARNDYTGAVFGRTEAGTGSVSSLEV